MSELPIPGQWIPESEHTPPGVEFAWNSETCLEQPFNLSVTLASGQNFRWRRDVRGIWWGSIEATVVAAWQAEGQPDSPLFWQTFPQPDQVKLIRDYFRLGVDLLRLYANWSARTPEIATDLAAFRGLRLLRQPPHECTFAFQCAACNSLVKIERSVAHLARHYGRPISAGLSSLPEFPGIGRPDNFYRFPDLNALAAAEEQVLREGLWGYRAPRVIALAKHLQQLPADWLDSLRQRSYSEAHSALTDLFGIGAKLADCICLFSLDKDAAIPVDTHIRQIAVRLFAPALAGKSLTPRVYSLLAETYRTHFGAYAGWAQQYLFFAELQRASAFRNG